MTELSPAAQAVIDTWWNASDGEYINGVWTPNRSAQLAAALEALADQADPKRHVEDISYQHQLYVDGWKDCLEVILAIANELKGDSNV